MKKLLLSLLLLVAIYSCKEPTDSTDLGYLELTGSAGTGFTNATSLNISYQNFIVYWESDGEIIPIVSTDGKLLSGGDWYNPYTDFDFKVRNRANDEIHYSFYLTVDGTVKKIY
ncbi:MAG TPA: hypothetical protein VKS21_05255 [Spirochaetota bacterium]|nr:hypothetical protein [Spirochaetota bacterium]